MIHVEYDEINDKAKLGIEGDLGQIFAELGLVIHKISASKEIEMSVDDVLEAIKESIDYNIEKKNMTIVS